MRRGRGHPYVVTASAPDRPFTILTRPAPIQQQAFDLLGFPIAWTQCMENALKSDVNLYI